MPSHLKHKPGPIAQGLGPKQKSMQWGLYLWVRLGWGGAPQKIWPWPWACRLRHSIRDEQAYSESYSISYPQGKHKVSPMLICIHILYHMS